MAEARASEDRKKAMAEARARVNLDCRRLLARESFSRGLEKARRLLAQAAAIEKEPAVDEPAAEEEPAVVEEPTVEDDIESPISPFDEGDIEGSEFDRAWQELDSPIEEEAAAEEEAAEEEAAEEPQIIEEPKAVEVKLSTGNVILTLPKGIVVPKIVEPKMQAKRVPIGMSYSEWRSGRTTRYTSG